MVARKKQQGKARCRLCAKLKKSFELLSLAVDFEEYMKAKQLLNMEYLDLSDLKRLPNTTCYNCHETLNECYRFFYEIESSQIELCRLYNVPKKDPREIIVQYYISNQIENLNEKQFNQESPNSAHCRFCAVKFKITDLISFSNDKGVTKEFWVMLQFFQLSYLDISQPKLPKTTCSPCYKSFNDAFIFLTNVKSCQITLDRLGKIKHESWTEYPWQCSHCNTWFSLIEELRCHGKEKHDTCYCFKCADCNVACNDFYTFVEHVRGHREYLRNTCQFCNEPFESVSECSDHVASHYACACARCGELFSDAAALVRHEQRALTWLEYEWCCQACGSRQPSVAALRQHARCAHKACFAMRCADCHTTTDNFGDFVTHVRHHRPNLKLYCEYCNKHFLVERDVQNHVALQHKTTQLCNSCGQIFKNGLDLDKHTQKYSNIKDIDEHSSEYSDTQDIGKQTRRYTKRTRKQKPIRTTKRRRYVKAIKSRDTISKEKVRASENNTTKVNERTSPTDTKPVRVKRKLCDETDANNSKKMFKLSQEVTLKSPDVNCEETSSDDTITLTKLKYQISDDSTEIDVKTTENVRDEIKQSKTIFTCITSSKLIESDKIHEDVDLHRENHGEESPITTNIEEKTVNNNNIFDNEFKTKTDDKNVQKYENNDGIALEIGNTMFTRDLKREEAILLEFHNKFFNNNYSDDKTLSRNSDEASLNIYDIKIHETKNSDKKTIIREDNVEYTTESENMNEEKSLLFIQKENYTKITRRATENSESHTTRSPRTIFSCKTCFIDFETPSKLKHHKLHHNAEPRIYDSCFKNTRAPKKSDDETQSHKDKDETALRSTHANILTNFETRSEYKTSKNLRETISLPKLVNEAKSLSNKNGDDNTVIAKRCDGITLYNNNNYDDKELKTDTNQEVTIELETPVINDCEEQWTDDDTIPLSKLKERIHDEITKVNFDMNLETAGSLQTSYNCRTNFIPCNSSSEAVNHNLICHEVNPCNEKTLLSKTLNANENHEKSLETSNGILLPKTTKNSEDKNYNHEKLLETNHGDVNNDETLFECSSDREKLKNFNVDETILSKLSEDGKLQDKNTRINLKLFNANSKLLKRNKDQTWDEQSVQKTLTATSSDQATRNNEKALNYKNESEDIPPLKMQEQETDVVEKVNIFSYMQYKTPELYQNKETLLLKNNLGNKSRHEKEFKNSQILQHISNHAEDTSKYAKCLTMSTPMTILTCETCFMHFKTSSELIKHNKIYHDMESCWYSDGADKIITRKTSHDTILNNNKVLITEKEKLINCKAPSIPHNAEPRMYHSSSKNTHTPKSEGETQRHIDKDETALRTNHEAYLLINTNSDEPINIKNSDDTILNNKYHSDKVLKSNKESLLLKNHLENNSGHEQELKNDNEEIVDNINTVENTIGTSNKEEKASKQTKITRKSTENAENITLEATFTCKICLMQFKTSSKLLKHNKKHHATCVYDNGLTATNNNEVTLNNENNYEKVLKYGFSDGSDKSVTAKYSEDIVLNNKYHGEKGGEVTLNNKDNYVKALKYKNETEEIPQSKLQDQEADVDENLSIFSCKTCFKEFKTSSKLVKHDKKYHRSQPWNDYNVYDKTVTATSSDEATLDHKNLDEKVQITSNDKIQKNIHNIKKKNKSMSDEKNEVNKINETNTTSSTKNKENVNENNSKTNLKIADNLSTIFTCNTCFKHFKSLLKLVKHCKSHHDAIESHIYPDNDKTLYVKNNDVALNNKTDKAKALIKHNAKIHNKAESRIVTTGNHEENYMKNLEFTSNLKEHAKIDVENTISTPELFTCKICFVQFKTSSKLMKHDRNHHQPHNHDNGDEMTLNTNNDDNKDDEKPRPSSSIREHEKNRDENKHVTCKACSKDFKTLSKLIKHEKIHLSQPCDNNKAANMPLNAENGDAAVYNAENIFKNINHNGKTLETKRSEGKAMENIYGEFTISSLQLQNETNGYENIKLFTCKSCFKRFKSLSKLMKHDKKHHGPCNQGNTGEYNDETVMITKTNHCKKQENTNENTSEIISDSADKTAHNADKTVLNNTIEQETNINESINMIMTCKTSSKRMKHDKKHHESPYCKYDKVRDETMYSEVLAQTHHDVNEIALRTNMKTPNNVNNIVKTIEISEGEVKAMKNMKQEFTISSSQLQENGTYLDESIKMFTCKSCVAHFKSSTKLIKHSKKYHQSNEIDNDNTFTANNSYKLTLNNENNTKNTQKNINGVKTIPPPHLHQRETNEIIKTNLKTTDNAEIVTPTAMFTCKTCSKQFKTSSKLIKHNKKHHEGQTCIHNGDKRTLNHKYVIEKSLKSVNGEKHKSSIEAALVTNGYNETLKDINVNKPKQKERSKITEINFKTSKMNAKNTKHSKNKNKELKAKHLRCRTCQKHFETLFERLKHERVHKKDRTRRFV